MTKPIEFIESLIQAANLKLIEVTEILGKLSADDAEFDVYIQIQKDLKSFVSDQEWTLSLVQDGSI